MKQSYIKNQTMIVLDFKKIYSQQTRLGGINRKDKPDEIKTDQKPKRKRKNLELYISERRSKENKYNRGYHLS